MNQISLSSPWHFRLDSEVAWRQIGVPGCWEQIGVRKDWSGPAWYRTSFTIPAEWSGQRIWLRFGAVSYYCEIFVNGRALGSHTGLWDSFAIEISAAAAPGTPAELLVRVEKPAGLTAGPDSASLPGRFPLRETLAGFLPYVWGHIFGGIWQEVTLYATGATIFEDVLVRGAADGRVSIAAALSGPGAVAIEIRDPEGALCFEATSVDSGDDIRWSIDDALAHRL
jgi:beta-galactosidase/beta-glucuronidase